MVVEYICHKYIYGPQQLRQGNNLEACPKLFNIFEEEQKSGVSREEFLHQIEDRYIAGLVVLHGTDTLAYSAAALAFSLQNLPFPVVLTGSNQPPNEQSILERDPMISESDAWKNILRCLLFLHTFGHRFTEVFVCFGETIHHAVNLRKTAIDQIPLLQESEHRSIQEPYVYRNQSTQRQYMYRYIDGLYCNNFYPVQARISYRALYQDREYRHARRSPLVTEREIRRSKFSSTVKMVMVSPSFLFMDCGQVSAETFQERAQGLKVLVVEGYNSGTFPTREGHPFTALLKILLRESIPIVLVSKHGVVPSQEPYKTQPVDGQEVTVLPLFSVIAETAVPLISLVFHDIPEEEWNRKGDEKPTDLLRRRLKLLEDGIRDRQKSHPNILNAVLDSILDESRQREVLTRELRQEELDYQNREQNLFTEARSNASKMQSERYGSHGPFSLTTTMVHQHFLWLLMGIVHPFEIAHSGPDGFSFINEMGFYFGREHLNALISDDPRENKSLLLRQTKGDVEKLIQRAESFTKHVAHFLYRSGMADIAQEVTVKPPQNADNLSDGSICLVIKVKKHGRLVRPDELFAVIGHRDEEAELFRQLREGCDLTLYEHECPVDLEQRYKDLFTTSWNTQTSSLDWFLIGVFKAVICGVLRDLMFDPWVQQCVSNNTPNYVNALRQSVTTTVLLADEHLLHVRFDYRARGIVALSEEG